MLCDLPSGRALESPLKKQKARCDSPVLPAQLPMPTSAAQLPSPALKVEYGNGASTPRLSKRVRRRATTARPNSAKSARPNVVSPPPLDHHARSDKKIKRVPFHGSEDESSNDDDEDDEVGFGTRALIVPRAARIYFSEEEEEEITEPPLQVDQHWPPMPLIARPVVLAAEDSTSPPQDVKPVLLSPVVESSGPSLLAAPDPAASTPHAAQFGPHKFDFQWRAFPEHQILPELRREPFSEENCGATAAYASPYDAFIAIWDRPIMEYIAGETNKYAQQLTAVMLANGISPNSRITRWVDTNVDELYVYFAIILTTGIVVKSRLEEYWNVSRDVFSTPEFTTFMRFDRFLLLSKCLHFNDNDVCNPETMNFKEAKLFKILPIVQHLNNKFESLYVLGRNIALDESLTMWKGCLNIRQTIPNKVAKIGIKTHEICESQTGYLWRFEVHAGPSIPSEPDSSPISGATPALVLRLLQGLEHRGHTVWMDNYYNSPALARELKLQGFDCVGTLRTDRQLVPAELTNLKVSDMLVGQICGCTSGDVDLLVWRDKTRLGLISTYHGVTTVWCGGVLKPSLVQDYNICMGGVDKKDQMLATYPIGRKRTKVWYKKFFRRLLNASVLNSYILLKNTQKMTHRDFRKTLIRQLLEHHNTPKASRSLNKKPYDSLHLPKKFDQATNESRRLRRKCVACAKRVQTYCSGCAVALCITGCFTHYHTKH